ncbi:MAG: diadenylate cyclase CdaA [Bacteroidota bacterium]|jgi:uncharacterized protein (TIGR00159 family)|nr:diadenylate cyclase CdaA [Bacteroidota bacterium]OQC34570.1 MAG: DNA integrity scanning protein DisA [Bacteroidetes bacterium ADurb.Bin057]HOH70580.1 diadenylate cyclase CdaA [Paludibacteraceae bacterium]HPW96477.1 diadenylate cyclase CdaA [Paludibacteraceae bacterium]
MGLEFGVKDIIDILLVTILLYQGYRLMKGTGTGNIFIGIISFIIFWFLITYVFKMRLMGTILNSLISVGAIALIVIFQSEIRHFFSRIGGSHKSWKMLKSLQRFFNNNKKTNESTFPVMKVVLACINMARSKTGALIVIARNASLVDYIESGEIINSEINTRLLENIFFKNSPLHDGAVIITNNKIVSAGAILPVSRDQSIPRNLGLRHRAAMGITEKTDALTIIVSEESGAISVAMNGKINLNLKAEELQQILVEEIQF